MSREAMNTQPEALRLADALDDEFTQGRISNHNGRKAAVELRRLHEVNQDLLKVLHEALEEKQKTAVSPDGGTGFIDGVWYGPPQRKPLTDEQIIKHFQEHVDTGSLLSFADGVRFAEAAHVEAKLKEKNT